MHFGGSDALISIRMCGGFINIFIFFLLLMTLAVQHTLFFFKRVPLLIEHMPTFSGRGYNDVLHIMTCVLRPDDARVDNDIDAKIIVDGFFSRLVVVDNFICVSADVYVCVFIFCWLPTEKAATLY